MSQKQRSIIAQLRSFIKRKTSQQYRFDLQFASDRWASLKSLEDLGRYSIIVGYTKYFCKNARILDLGCGEGVLFEKFAPTDYAQYTGVDFSKVAIEHANAMAKDNVNFIVGDLNHLNIEGNYDVIIYNESINYLSKPDQAALAIAGQLNPGGIIIISLVDKYGNEQVALWEKLGKVLDILERTKVTNLEGNSWTIQVYKAKI